MAKEYERIANDLRRSIRDGDLRPGDRLPSEAELVERYGKSGPTVQAALRVLQYEGLIDKQHGRGSFVRRPRSTVLRTNERHQWEKDRAREAEEHRLKTGATEYDTGLKVDDLVFHASYKQIEAPKDIADAFGVPAGTALVERTYRTRYAAERAPFALVTSYLVCDIVAENPDLLDETKEPWPGGTMNQLHTVGIELARIEERFTTRPPTPEEAEELELPPGMPVLLARKISYDTNDRPVEISDITLPGDRTHVHVVTHLDRW
ncbi:GntR family transcriptional regulator [Streptomyces aculeolatus]